MSALAYLLLAQGSPIAVQPAAGGGRRFVILYDRDEPEPEVERTPIRLPRPAVLAITVKASPAYGVLDISVAHPAVAAIDARARPGEAALRVAHDEWGDTILAALEVAMDDDLVEVP